MVVKRKKISVGPICAIHCSYTPKFLIVLGVITALTQYVGKPNRCTVDGVSLPGINEDCGVVGTTVTVGDPDGFQSEVSVPAYYRWICWFLFLQAFLCCIPNWPRKTCEKFLEKFIAELNDGRGPRSEEDFVESKQILRKYIVTHLNHHNKYALAHWLCRGLCLANAVFQALMIHWFLNGHFVGDRREIQILEGKLDSLAFSDVANCTVGRFDSFGKILEYEAVCSVPWNTFNEKIYILLEIWFIILAILHLIVVIVLTIIMIGLPLPTMRTKFLRIRFPKIPLHLLECLSRRISFGDFWFLDHLRENIKQSILSDIITDVAEHFYKEV